LYYRFRLNWIILLAFHSLYINTSTTAYVGLLIDKMHEAFLGWMSRERETFELLFSSTVTTVPTVPTSYKTYSEKVNGIIKDDINGHPRLISTVKTIRNKLCEFVAQTNAAADDDDDDDDDNDDDDNDDDDPDYVPSDDSDIEVSVRSGAAIVPNRPKSPQPGTGNPRMARPASSTSSTGAVKGSEASGPQSNVSRLNLQMVNSLNPYKSPVTERFINEAVAAAANRRRPPRLPSPDIPGDVKMSTWPDTYGYSATAGGVELHSVIPTSRPFQHRARQNISPHRPSSPDVRWAFPYPPGQKPSPPPTSLRSPDDYIRSQRRPLSASSSRNSTIAYQGSATGSFTDRTGPRRNQVLPIKGSVNPEHHKATSAVDGKPGSTPRLTKTNKVAPAPGQGQGQGGSHKKRTRKHKKHTSISASRRPTRRRRRIPPTEGHKYTRKRPRT
jgi:hypothetical protein